MKSIPALTASLFALSVLGCATSATDNADDTEAEATQDVEATAAATCASGYACIHSGTTQASTITNRYYNYGCYKLYDQHGKHLVENNQTGEALVAFYTGSSCQTSTLIEGWAAPYDFVENLEAANSVRLYPQ